MARGPSERPRPQAAEVSAWARRIRDEPASIAVELHSGPRGVVVTLDASGGVLAREHGGPVHASGQLVSARWPTVACWRSSGTPQLHAELLAALVELGFPDVPRELLVPDERPSSFTLRHAAGPQASIEAPRRLLARSPELRRLEGELDRICYATQTTRPTGSIPNPELSLWP